MLSRLFARFWKPKSSDWSFGKKENQDYFCAEASSIGLLADKTIHYEENKLYSQVYSMPDVQSN